MAIGTTWLEKGKPVKERGQTETNKTWSWGAEQRSREDPGKE